VGCAGEARPQVFADVASEERRHTVSPVLANVGELVREEPPGVGSVPFDCLACVRREENPAPEDDRVRSGDRRQEPGDAPRVKSRAPDLALEFTDKVLRERGRNRDARQLPKSGRRSEAICFNSTL
jgi:hypothetical protein